jgi:group II intron reverse transcriptase/maturase
MALSLEERGEAPGNERSGEVRAATSGTGNLGSSEALMERIVENENVAKALKRVEQNKGSAGIDGMTTEELRPHLRQNWRALREQLLEGSYQPKPVKTQEIPKSGGGMRKLGIPTVLDRFIQQAILQVLQPRLDPTFSESSYGFRPRRSAHDAVRAAQRYVLEGKTWVVDVDLEKFFDRVNHDVLMGRLARRINDKRLLGVIRRYLTAGVMVNGVVRESGEGTPQGGPLSPLLANVLLDEVDKELEKRGLAFARYADDCNVYVQSKRAAEDAMATMKSLYEALRLRINESKSAVGRPWTRKFLGYSFLVAPRRKPRLCVAPQALNAMKKRVRHITRRICGRSMKAVVEELGMYMPGWRTYFRLAETKGVFKELDRWIRHRIRALQLKQWRNVGTIKREMMKLGAEEKVARGVSQTAGRWWAGSGTLAAGTMNRYYMHRLGVPMLSC